MRVTAAMIVFETFIQKLLPLQNPFRVFRVFRGSFYKFWHSKKDRFAVFFIIRDSSHSGS